VHGLGGLGHLGVQYAKAMGFEVAAVARGAEKEDFARKLGRAHYIDSDKQEAAQVLARRGGARVILATAPSAQAISSIVGGLGIEGCLLVVAAPFEPIQLGQWISFRATDASRAGHREPLPIPPTPWNLQSEWVCMR